MPKQIWEDDILPSILDRLVGDKPVHDLEDLKASLARDLEALLNTRQQALEEIPAGLNISHSLLTYGIPDFTSYNVNNQDDRKRIRKALEQTVRDFEPRLERVNVVLEPAGENSHAALHFRIEGLLRVEPAPEPVIFNAVLEVNTQQLTVKGDG